MCIRDRSLWFDFTLFLVITSLWFFGTDKFAKYGSTSYYICLLYTSDAADERSSVDLGGRRIIKKQNDKKSIRARQLENEKIRDKRTENTYT